jgi:hypothetical protein
VHRNLTQGCCGASTSDTLGTGCCFRQLPHVCLQVVLQLTLECRAA